MGAALPETAPSRLFLSGNEAVALAVRDAGCRVAAAYPGTPATEILEELSRFPDLYTEWSVNEKVSLEVALGASMMGSRAFCAMKHVGLNVAADALMTMTVTGTEGGLVIAVADDVGMSSSQNEQDSRFWARFAHLPLFEPADAQESYDMAREAFAVSERFRCPAIVRLTTRICHVKGRVVAGEREAHEPAGFVKDPQRWVMVPGHAKPRVALMYEREEALRAASAQSPFNLLVEGSDRRIGFVTSGPAYMHVRETFPDAPVFKLGQSYPLPLERLREFAAGVDQLLVVEETEPLVESELRAGGIACTGKDVLPRVGELSPDRLRPAVARLRGEEVPAAAQPRLVPQQVFPRPPTMCVACPHLGIYYTLAQLRNLTISGDIGCYTLGAGHPWNALDTCISMAPRWAWRSAWQRAAARPTPEAVIAVIGDVHLHAHGHAGPARHHLEPRQRHRAAARQPRGRHDRRPVEPRHRPRHPRRERAAGRLRQAVRGAVKKERIHTLDPYELPTLFKTLRDEIKVPEPSVIITDRPCVLIDDYKPTQPYKVIADKCTGCANCIDVGCPAIHVTRRETQVKPSGKEVELAFVRIETSACTGCGLCVQPCAPEAIVHALPEHPVKFLHAKV